MNQVLLFPDHDEPQYYNESSLYLSIYTEDDYQITQLKEFSPHIMRWSEHIYLMDLSFTLNYWMAIAGQTQSHCHILWEKMIGDHLAHENFTAVVAHHPWQSLLLLSALEDIGTKGITLWQSNYGQNVLRHLSWETWWRLVRNFLRHSADHNFLNAGQISKTEQGIVHMKKVMQQMSCRYPSQLQQTPTEQIRRRFGLVLEELWSWSYSSQSKMKNSLEYTTPFPWQSQVEEEKAFVKRSLDFPVETWEQIEEFIREDLNKLCLSPSFNKEMYTMSLEWRVVLQDLKEIPVKIFFRHPHSLPAQIPTQRTALLQIKHNFFREMIAAQKVYDDIEQVAPHMVAWTLGIGDELAKPQFLVSLFEDNFEGLYKLINLENQIHTPLYTYETIDNWIPEHSYRQGQSKDPLVETAQARSIHALASQRPLFTYKNPLPFAQSPTSAMWKFVERTMDQWWFPHSSNTRRDYYQYINDNKKYWIYRDFQGKWYVHGIYA